MEYSTVTKSGRLTHSGVKLAAYLIAYPETEEAPVIGAFCRRYAEAFEAAIGGCIRDRLVDEYERSADPKKRFRHRPAEITLSYRVTQDTDGIFSIVWYAQISRRGETIFCRKSAQTWDAQGGTLFTAHDFGVGRRRNSTCHFYLERDECVILGGEEELRCPIKRRFQAPSPPPPQAHRTASP